MLNSFKNRQSFRKSGNSAFYNRIIAVKHPIIKLSFPFFLLFFAIILNKTGVGCVYRHFLGFPCPGCGMTRAYLAFLRGDLAAAFRWHFMFPFVPVLYLYIWFDGKLFKNKTLNLTVLISILLGFLIHWIIAIFTL